MFRLVFWAAEVNLGRYIGFCFWVRMVILACLFSVKVFIEKGLCFLCASLVVALS